MTRICLSFLFCVMALSCAKPVQLEIPLGHPANPQASAAPVPVHSHYRYHLPSDGELPGKTGSAEASEASSQKSSGEDEAIHKNHKPMSSEKAGGGHEH
jgi:hypothetical protein